VNKSNNNHKIRIIVKDLRRKMRKVKKFVSTINLLKNRRNKRF